MFEILVARAVQRHIVENASFKSCQNPACGQSFVRQEGGASTGSLG